MVDEHINNKGINTAGDSGLSSSAGGQGGWSNNQVAASSSTEQPRITGDQDFTRSKKKRRWLVVIVLLALLGLMGGGTAAAHFAGWITIPFLPRHYEPREVLSRMYESLPDIESAGYKMGVKVYTEDRKTEVEPLGQGKAQKKIAVEDVEKVRDSITVIKYIQEHQQAQENNKYPSSLLAVTPSYMREKIGRYLNNAEIRYRVMDGGNDFYLLIKLSSTDFFNKSYSYQDGILINASNMTGAVDEMEDAIVKPTTNSVSSFVPADFRIEMNMEGEMQKSGKEARQGSYKIDGLVKLGGSTFEGDIRSIMHKDNLFIRVNEFPSLGFFDMSAIKGQWVRLEADEVEEVVGREGGNRLEIDRRTDQLARQYKIALKVAQELEMIQVTKEYPMIKEDGRELYHYEIDLATEKMPLYYETLAKRLEQEYGKEALFAFDEKIFKELSKQSSKQISTIKKNTTMELWVDNDNFYPAKYKVTSYAAPPDTIEKFKGKQFTTVFSVELENINQQVRVKVPGEYISKDKAMELVTGKNNFEGGANNGSLNSSENDVESKPLQFEPNE